MPASGAVSSEDLLLEGSAAKCGAIFIADSDFGRAAHDPKVVERLREAKFLAVMGWADSPLARVADVVLPVATHAERAGTFVNAEWRVQRFEQAFPAPPQVRPGVEALADLLSRFDPKWSTVTPATVFDLMAEEVQAFRGLRYREIAAEGTRSPRCPKRRPPGREPNGAWSSPRPSSLPSP